MPRSVLVAILLIEDVGPSDLYDPWGGRPVGLARVESGALLEPVHAGRAPFGVTNPIFLTR